MEDVTNGDLNAIPELLEVPPPPPKNLLPDPGPESPTLEKPNRRSSIELGQYIHPSDDDGEAAGVTSNPGKVVSFPLSLLDLISVFVSSNPNPTSPVLRDQPR